jgi:Rha family phage regulatory protein
MKKMKIVSINGKLLADSREVAEMVGKDHAHLMRDIRGYVEIMNASENPKLDSLEFFLPSTYKVEGNNKTYECYKITRKGCDMVANKMTGEKGVLFTATYVTKFEEMERQLSNPAIQLPQNYKEALLALVASVEKVEQLEDENAELRTKVKYVDQILMSKATMTITQIAKDYGLSGPQLNKILHEERVQYKQNKQWLLYQKYSDKGYTRSETIDITRSNGDPDVTLNTRWTQKGRLFIHELLGKRGIVPFMDRQHVAAQ